MSSATQVGRFKLWCLLRAGLLRPEKGSNFEASKRDEGSDLQFKLHNVKRLIYKYESNHTKYKSKRKAFPRRLLNVGTDITLSTIALTRTNNLVQHYRYNTLSR